MTGGKQIQRQLKGPDAFQAKMLRFLDALFKRKSLLLTVLVTMVVVVGGIWGVKHFGNRKDLTRKEELAKIDAVYNHEMEGVEKEREVLQKQASELRAKLPTDAKQKKPEHAAIESQIKGLESKMADIKGNHDASMAQYKAYFDKNPTTPEGWAAGMRYAAFLLEKDDLKGARPVLETIFDKSRASLVYQTQSGMALIGVLEDSGEVDAALEKVELLLKTTPDTMKPKVLLTKSRLQLAKNAKKEAQDTLDGLIKNHAATPEADQARGMKALIN